MGAPTLPRQAGSFALALAIALVAGHAAAQVDPPPPAGSRTATVVAGARYQAGGLRRLLLGDTYRDLWATPITVPVLDLGAFAGGLTPTKTGGGNQTRSLRLEDPAGNQFVFRLVDKDGLALPAGFRHTILEGMTRDQISAHHPAGAVVANQLLTAGGIPHPTPMLTVMPDDILLGEFREDFAGCLGLIEPFPATVKGAAGLAGAEQIIDSDSLRVLLDEDPREQVDALAFLTARLADMLLNDWDRHPGNWKWGRVEPAGAWRPIARDRDKVMIGYGGVAALAGAFIPILVRFQEGYPRMRGLTWNSIDLDRRLLSGLEAADFDSVAGFLVGRFTDPVIEAAVRTMPVEYHSSAPLAAAKLMARRDSLPTQAREFYLYLATIVDVHATDAADRAIVTLVDDRYVDLEIGSAGAAPHFQRRFDARETGEIRLYLHGGDDRAEVRGEAPAAIPVRVIGGNGVNELTDSSTPDGRARAVRMYDPGSVTATQYGPDELFDRRPWPRRWGRSQLPGRDRGGKTGLILKLGAPGDLGIVPRLGMDKVQYGFRKHPYASRAALTAEYSTGVSAWRVTGLLDQRREASPVHVTVAARMSELEILHYHGLGNDTPAGPEALFDARQRQWLLHPAVAYALGPRTDISLGPVFQYSTSDSVPGRLLSEQRPYGFGDFGQLGLRLGLFSDSRNRTKSASRGLLLDLSATVYPPLWDVTSTFAALAATAGAYYTVPVLMRPVVALRAGAKQLLGHFPFHEAAFLGGRASVRRLARERYAGEAALYGTAELQVPVASFAFVLPLDLGVYGYVDTGRVYVDRDSPGGWHEGTGVGFWVGLLNPTTAVSLELGDQRGRSGLRVRTGLSF